MTRTSAAKPAAGSDKTASKTASKRPKPASRETDQESPPRKRPSKETDLESPPRKNPSKGTEKEARAREKAAKTITNQESPPRKKAAKSTKPATPQEHLARAKASKIAKIVQLDIIAQDKRLYLKLPSKTTNLKPNLKLFFTFCKKDLFKITKFINNQEECISGAKWAMKRNQPNELIGLVGDDLKAAVRIWLYQNADLARQALNHRRNYCKEVLEEVYPQMVFGKKEDQFPTPEDVEEIVFRRNMEEGNPKREANLAKLVNMIDYCISKIAGNHAFGEGVRHVTPMLTAMQPRDGRLRRLRAVTPSDLAFFIVMLENYYPVWVYQYKKRKGTLEEGEKAPQTEHTVSKVGVPEFGGWTLAARKKFEKLRLQLVEEEDTRKEAILAADMEALQALRIRHDLVGKENKRKKGKPKFDLLALKDGESDLEMKNDYDDSSEEDEEEEEEE